MHLRGEQQRMIEANRQRPEPGSLRLRPGWHGSVWSFFRMLNRITKNLRHAEKKWTRSAPQHGCPRTSLSVALCEPFWVAHNCLPLAVVGFITNDNPRTRAP